jgi:hypothetical protein
VSSKHKNILESIVFFYKGKKALPPASQRRLFLTKNYVAGGSNKKNMQARLDVFFYLNYLLVTQRGFEPPTVRAEI